MCSVITEDVSRLNQHLESEQERDMRKSFREQVNNILEDREKFNTEEKVKIGLETEYPTVLEGSLTPTPGEIRDRVIQDLDFADTEVGAHHVETRTDPIVIDSLEELYSVLAGRESELIDKASDNNIEVLRNGTNPFISFDNIEKTDKEKYDIVPGFHDEMRNGHVSDTFGINEVVDPRNADIAGVISSAQTNIEASGLEDAVDKANLSYMITPYMVALSTNSRFIDGKDTGINDTRMPLWEKSHDIRSPEDLQTEDVSAGKIGSYYEDIRDYFDRVETEPFILDVEDAAMDIGIGTFWKDARIKFNYEPEEGVYEPVVESRAMSTQPTPEEEIAVHGFYIGRLIYAQQNQEDLLDIEKTNRNRYAAMHNGLDTKLYDPQGDLRDAEEVLEKELAKAEEGLELAGIDQSYSGEKYDTFMDILYERLDTGVPSDLMAEEFQNSIEQGLGRDEALMKGLKNTGI